MTPEINLDSIRYSNRRHTSIHQTSTYIHTLAHAHLVELSYRSGIHLSPRCHENEEQLLSSIDDFLCLSLLEQR